MHRTKSGACVKNIKEKARPGAKEIGVTPVHWCLQKALFACALGLIYVIFGFLDYKSILTNAWDCGIILNVI